MGGYYGLPLCLAGIDLSVPEVANPRSTTKARRTSLEKASRFKKRSSSPVIVFLKGGLVCRRRLKGQLVVAMDGAGEKERLGRNGNKSREVTATKSVEAVTAETAAGPEVKASAASSAAAAVVATTGATAAERTTGAVAVAAASETVVARAVSAKALAVAARSVLGAVGVERTGAAGTGAESAAAAATGLAGVTRTTLPAVALVAEAAAAGLAGATKATPPAVARVAEAAAETATTAAAAGGGAELAAASAASGRVAARGQAAGGRVQMPAAAAAKPTAATAAKAGAASAGGAPESGREGGRGGGGGGRRIGGGSFQEDMTSDLGNRFRALGRQRLPASTLLSEASVTLPRDIPWDPQPFSKSGGHLGGGERPKVVQSPPQSQRMGGRRVEQSMEEGGSDREEDEEEEEEQGGEGEGSCASGSSYTESDGEEEEEDEEEEEETFMTRHRHALRNEMASLDQLRRSLLHQREAATHLSAVRLTDADDDADESADEEELRDDDVDATWDTWQRDGDRRPILAHSSLGEPDFNPSFDRLASADSPSNTATNDFHHVSAVASSPRHTVLPAHSSDPLYRAALSNNSFSDVASTGSSNRPFQDLHVAQFGGSGTPRLGSSPHVTEDSRFTTGGAEEASSQVPLPLPRPLPFPRGRRGAFAGMASPVAPVLLEYRGLVARAA
eukprot:TRINITY_DN5119_c3_g4_i1.p1 TRINITY_DN5119_c3_g4~~TRINITY_DN5119_c3_g4_i1.p1  ORF type:complete len:676 (-),score=188.62 TRINITY_DN5119_c3_g4_i1:2852-4879(-)